MNHSASVRNEGWMDSEVIDLRLIFVRLWKGRWWVVSSVFLFSIGFTAAAFLFNPTYQATTVMLPASAERSSLGNSLNSALGSLGGLASLAGVINFFTYV